MSKSRSSFFSSPASRLSLSEWLMNARIGMRPWYPKQPAHIHDLCYAVETFGYRDQGAERIESWRTRISSKTTPENIGNGPRSDRSSNARTVG